MLPTCKPDSVSGIFIPNGYHLSVPKFAFRDQSAYPSARASSSQSPTYVAFQHTRFTRPNSYLIALWALTPHFHRYSQKSKLLRAVIFCGTFCLQQVGARLFTGALLFAVQTFLFHFHGNDNPVGSEAKIQ